MRKQKIQISYEPDADVLMWETSKQTIDYAREIGNVVVHFSKKNNPVLIEILQASQFLSKAEKLLNKAQKEPIKA